MAELLYQASSSGFFKNCVYLLKTTSCILLGHSTSVSLFFGLKHLLSLLDNGVLTIFLTSLSTITRHFQKVGGR